MDDQEEPFACKHGGSIKPHTCPFQYDVHGDRESLCRCCEECEQECADNI